MTFHIIPWVCLLAALLLLLTESARLLWLDWLVLSRVRRKYKARIKEALDLSRSAANLLAKYNLNQHDKTG